MGAGQAEGVHASGVRTALHGVLAVHSAGSLQLVQLPRRGMGGAHLLAEAVAQVCSQDGLGEAGEVLHVPGQGGMGG